MQIRGRGYKERVVHWFARTQPSAARGLAWVWAHTQARLARNTKAPWTLNELLCLSESRILVTASLFNGMKVVVPWNDHVGGHIYRDGYYERDTLRLVERLLRPGMVFIDVGAHIGQYSLVAGPIVGPRGQVHSFEPDPVTFELLSANVRTNGLDNVRLNRIGLDSGAGKKSLYLATTADIGSNSLVRPDVSLGRSCEIECVSLDAYLKARDVQTVDFMKIDVEGAEYDVLQGAAELLSARDAPVLVIEFEEERQQAFGRSCAQLAELLRSYGYSLRRVDSARFDEYEYKPNDVYSLNVLAIPAHRCESTLTTLVEPVER